MKLEIGSVLDGKYKILSEIGHGGMSVVYMAINEKANKTWAVKQVRKNGTMDFKTVRQGLIDEIDTLKHLKHPHLPSIIDVIEDEDNFIIVMDYIEGHSLDKILSEEGAQPEKDVVKWAIQLCDVFIYLHSRKPPIIYRDMKPANVMLKPDGNIMVIDFGTAKKYEVSQGETTGIGTVGYAAPEQFIGSGIGRSDARTDIYCLGMTMYHLLTNVDPCKNLIENKSIRAVNPSLSYGLDQIVQKCTMYKPSDRYQSAAELKYDLENYEKLEPSYQKKQRFKLNCFYATAIMAMAFAVCGLILNFASLWQTTSAYDSQIDLAAKTVDYGERVRLYEDCIALTDQAGRKEAYLGLIQTFKENDYVYTPEEEKVLTTLLHNHREDLSLHTQDYVEICFEMGKLYWYYYDYGDDSQITRAKSAIEWFQDVVNNAPDDYENLAMAKVYLNIGIFYRDVTTNITEASDKGTYAPLFEDLSELVTTVADDESQSEIVRLELVELTRSAMQQYATKFKTDGISQQKIEALYQNISDVIGTIQTTTERTTQLKETARDNLPDTQKSIQVAYGSGKEAGQP